MTTPTTTDSAANEQDLAFQRRSSVAQRIGWLVVAALLLAAGLRLMGNGPLGGASALGSSRQLQLEYERFAQANVPLSLQLTIAPQLLKADTTRIWFDRSYLRQVELEAISPPPQAIITEGERLVYLFPTPRAQSPFQVNFTVNPDVIGSLRGEAGIGSATVDFRHFVYP